MTDIATAAEPDHAPEPAPAPGPAHPWTDTSAHPWRRYLARSIDGLLTGLVTWLAISIVLYIVAPDTAAAIEAGLGGTFGVWLSGLMILALGIPLQALLVCAFGGGPGKWLLGVRVTDAEGRRLGYGAALWREAQVWALGLGCGLPFVSLFTLISSYGALEDGKVMAWDAEAGHVVTHRREGVVQTIGLVVAAVLLVVVRLAGMAGTLADQFAS